MNDSLQREVVITGIGIVSPLGSNNESIAGDISQKKSGIRKSTPDDPWFNSGLSHAAAVDYTKDFVKLKFRKNKRYMRRNVLFFIEALRLALEDGNMKKVIEENPRDIAIITSCGDSGTDFRGFMRSVRISLSNEDSSINMKRYGARGLNLQDPYFLMYDLVNSANCFSAIEYGFNGESNNFIMTGGTGIHSVKSGYETISSGRADIAVVGASESLLNGVEMPYLYSKLGACRDNEGTVVPYSDRMLGIVPGEGAAVLILEEKEHARERGASCYGKISSYATCVDLNDDLFTADKSGEGAARCIEHCLARSDEGVFTNMLVVAAGMALEHEDTGELAALKKVFSGKQDVNFTTFKPNFGYLGPVSDILDFSLGLICIKKESVLPVKTTGEKAAACGIDFCTEEKKQKINSVLSISKGFGGYNSAILAQRCD